MFSFPALENDVNATFASITTFWFVQKERKSLLPDAFHGSTRFTAQRVSRLKIYLKYTFVAEALPRTPLGSLQRSIGPYVYLRCGFAIGSGEKVGGELVNEAESKRGKDRRRMFLTSWSMGSL